jgi:hypothetical protein
MSVGIDWSGEQCRYREGDSLTLACAPASASGRLRFDCRAQAGEGAAVSLSLQGWQSCGSFRPLP